MIGTIVASFAMTTTRSYRRAIAPASAAAEARLSVLGFEPAAEPLAA